MRGFPDAEKLAKAAVASARARLVGSLVGKTRIDSFFSYGAVDIDTAHLVVWVLLSGLPDDELPRWWFGADATREAKSTRVDPDLLAKLDEIRTAVREELSRFGWPDAEHAAVGFDSDHRVSQQPGIDYFR